MDVYPKSVVRYRIARGQDVEWQKNIISQLNYQHISEPMHLIPYIRKSFAYLRICKVTEKDEMDCRSHFFNKLKKEYLKPVGGINLSR